MRSRFTGKRLLLAAAVAGASVTATTVPAKAAPPPDHQVDDCAKALEVLSSFKLLPKQPDLGRTLCSIAQLQKDQKDEYTNEVHTEYTDENGKKVERDTALGSVEWLKSLTVNVPTTNDRWYVYTSKNR
ncbi:hypothetical protein ACQEU6_41070 [Spirillospora sp. CA-108201]